MTIEDFDKMGFAGGMRVKYKDGKTYDIASVDFEERLIGLYMEIPGSDEGDIDWKRCENCELIN